MHLEMEPGEDEERWLEEQWERWLTHDISLEEFEDEDFSEITEITDECGLSLHCKETLGCRAHVTEPHGPQAAGRIQAEMLELDLIDAGDEILEEEVDPPPRIMDQYRPKRPTTLNLFPQVPRTQDTLNNNSLGKKNSWQERVSRSSSPLKTGEQSSPHEHICLSDEGNLRNSSASTKDCGTSTDSPCRRSAATQSAVAATNVASSVPEKQPGSIRLPHQPYQHQHNPQQPQHVYPVAGCSVRGSEAHRDRIRYQTDVRLEATEEIYLTPVQKNSDPQEPDRRFPSQSSDNRMSTSSDVDTSNYQSVSGKPNSSISEEDEVLDYLSSPEKGHIGRASCHSTHGYRSSYGTQRASVSSDTSALSYDSVKYTLVVDEHAQLELVSLKQCYAGYSDESDSGTVYDNCVSSPYESAAGEEYEDDALKRDSVCASEDLSSSETDIPFSKKFLNVFMSGRSRSSSAESFGFFSCIINGEEREQTHRAVFRFVPRHDDELELQVDDPLLVEVQAEDFWYEAFNMRTGDRGIFPAYYAIEVTKEQDPFTATVKSSDWMETFAVKFLGSVQVPYHKGNDVMCAAMQKIANSRRLTLHFNPPSSCILEITMRGVKIVVISDDPRDQTTVNMCSHFFQLKNISFCGYHPKNNKYFGFITKHPADHRFACHVFVSEQSTKALAESVGRAFQLYYKEVIEYTCPTEDIYIE